MRQSWVFSSATAVLLCAGLATAGSPEGTKTVPFALDEWVDLDIEDGPVKLHRLRLAQKTGLTKSKIFRPGNSEYTETVQLQVEYTNRSTRDWKVKMSVRWLDDSGATIDGYNGSEDLDEESRHERATATVATLRYGLNQARKLAISLQVDPD